MPSFHVSRLFARKLRFLAPTANPSISAPFNSEVIPNSTNHLKPDNPLLPPTLSAMLSRHALPPGIQFVSDLHLERHAYKMIPDIPPRAPYLILAGDIGRFIDRDDLLPVLRDLCNKFKKVLYVPGNHEFYGTSREEGLKIAAEMKAELDGKGSIWEMGWWCWGVRCIRGFRTMPWL